MPTVSIIIPTYNRAELITQTLQSVRAQTFSDWECIVVDDGSTDETHRVVERVAAEDARFRLIRQANSTAAAARNRGAAEARGEFLAFLDDDDLFEPDKLQWQVAALRDNPDAALVYGETFNFQDGDPGKGGLYLEHVKRKPQGRPPVGFERLLVCSSIYAPLVRSATFRATGGFDTSLPSAEDWDMWLTLSRRGTLLFEPRIALRYRHHGGLTGNKSTNTLRNLRCACRVFEKHLQAVAWHRRPGFRLAKRRYFRRGYGARLLAEADRATNAGDWGRARELWRELAWLSPSLLWSHKHVLVNSLWSALPTQKPPIWRRKQAGAT
jgi:glycosyltransferase involved in cell wall biosynthesis